MIELDDAFISFTRRIRGTEVRSQQVDHADLIIEVGGGTTIRYVIRVVFRRQPAKGDTGTERLLNHMKWAHQSDDAFAVAEDGEQLRRWLAGEELIPAERWKLADECEG